MTAIERLEELERLHAESGRWARACCGAYGDAEGVLQNVYVKILEGRARFEGRSSFKTWLFAVIRKTAAEEFRRVALRRWLLQAVGSVPAPAPAWAEQSDRSILVGSALARLPARQRQLLQLVFYHGLTIEEAAVAMSVSAGTARRHYDRAKKRMRSLIEERGTDEDRRRAAQAL